MKKRIISSIMCVAMLLSLLPVSAFAAEPADTLQISAFTVNGENGDTPTYNEATDGTTTENSVELSATLENDTGALDTATIVLTVAADSTVKYSIGDTAPTDWDNVNDEAVVATTTTTTATITNADISVSKIVWLELTNNSEKLYYKLTITVNKKATEPFAITVEGGTADPDEIAADDAVLSQNDELTTVSADSTHQVMETPALSVKMGDNDTDITSNFNYDKTSGKITVTAADGFTVAGDISISGIFEAKQTQTETWTVTFDENNGTWAADTADADKTVAVEKDPGKLTANAADAVAEKLSRTGYTFAGWGTAADTAVADVIDFGADGYAITEDTTLYAVWSEVTAEMVTVKFNAGEGATLTQDPIQQAAGTTVDLTDITPTKTGYVFQGWKLGTAEDSSASKTAFKIPDDASGEITLVAVWKSDSIVSANLYSATEDPTSLVEGVKVTFTTGTAADETTPVTIALEGAIPPVTSDTTYYLVYVTELGTKTELAVTVKKASSEITAELTADITVGEYVYSKTIDATNLVEANIVSADPVVDAAIDGLEQTKQEELSTALTDANTEIEIGDLVAAVAASADMDTIKNDSKYTEAVEAGQNPKIEVYLDIAASNYTDNALVLNITPAARVVDADAPATVIIDKVDLTTKSVGENGVPVTISITLPATLADNAATGNTFVKHDNQYLDNVTVDSTTKKVTFTTSSFSPFEIVVDTRTITITFLDEVGGSSLGTVTLNLASIDKTMEALLEEINYEAPSGKTLSGWGETADGEVVLPISGTLTNDMLTALTEKGSTLTLVPVLKDSSTGDNGSGSTGGSGGGGGGSTTKPTDPTDPTNPTDPTDPGSTGKTTFTDVAADAYYADAVKWAVENNITNGLTATTFGPNNSCTRGQMVTFLWRAAGSPAATGTNSFSDVASGEYYYDAVLWAVEKGITNGTSATTFSPNATVNRGQTVTFLYRYAESPAATGASSFTDVAADAYYADAVKWAVAEGITNGTSATTFAPASNCTRGQIVTFMYRQMAE